MKKSLFVLIYLLIFSCNEKVSEERLAYENNIFSWYTRNYQQIQQDSPTDNSNVWYLFFDDELTCETCKLKILSQVKDNTSVIVLTSFSNQNSIKAFKSTYRLKNILINFDGNSRNLSVPFLFQMDKTRMYNLTVLDEQMLEQDLLDFMDEH